MKYRRLFIYGDALPCGSAIIEPLCLLLHVHLCMYVYVCGAREMYPIAQVKRD